MTSLEFNTRLDEIVSGYGGKPTSNIRRRDLAETTEALRDLFLEVLPEKREEKLMGRLEIDHRKGFNSAIDTITLTIKGE